jgi:hypothetical protein
MRWLRLFAVVVTALASAGCAPKYIAEGAQFMSSPSGESVLFVAEGLAGRWIRRRSLENGALLASVWFFKLGGKGGSTAECKPAVPGRLWCLENHTDPLSGNGLRVRDEESLEIIAEQDQILGRTPELAHEPRIESWNVDPKTHGFLFESRDGYAWIIDPTTLVPSRFAGRIPETHKSPFGRTEVPGPGYSFDRSTRTSLFRDDKPLHPEHTYLEPKLGEPVDDWPHVLVVEHVIGHGPTLWCLSPDGAVEWKVKNFQDNEWARYVTAGKLYRDTVVLVGNNRVVALRARDGAVMWTSPP